MFREFSKMEIEKIYMIWRIDFFYFGLIRPFISIIFKNMTENNIFSSQMKNLPRNHNSKWKLNNFSATLIFVVRLYKTKTKKMRGWRRCRWRLCGWNKRGKKEKKKNMHPQLKKECSTKFYLITINFQIFHNFLFHSNSQPPSIELEY